METITDFKTKDMHQSIFIKASEYHIEFNKYLTGGYGGGPNFPDGESSGPQYDYEILSVTDEYGDLINPDDKLQNEIIQELIWGGY